MKKAVVAVVALSLLMLFPTLAWSAPASPFWYQVNQNGFGKPGTQPGPTLFVFGQDLYAYSSDNTYGLFRMKSAADRLWEQLVTPINPAAISVAFNPFDSYLYAFDLTSNQLWWIVKGQSFIIGNWKLVASNGLPGGVSPQPMAVFNNKLYGVYYTAAGTVEIWRTADIGNNVMNWERVVQNSFGDPANNKMVDIMAVFNNHVYAGTKTRDPGGNFGDPSSYGAGVEIWESSSGDFGTWTQINTDGFGTQATDPISGATFRTNQDIGSWCVYKAPNQQHEYLYIGTLAHFGAQVWRYDGTGIGGWTNVSPSWAPGPIPFLVGTPTLRFNGMIVFQGSLYVTEGFPSAQLDKYDGTDWSIEVGVDQMGSDEPPFAPQNTHCVSIAALGNKLYVAAGPYTGDPVGDQVWGYPLSSVHTLSLTPATSSNAVGTTHTVTATLRTNSTIQCLVCQWTLLSRLDQIRDSAVLE